MSNFFWPENLSSNIQSPRVVLIAMASELSQVTKDILHASVRTIEEPFEEHEGFKHVLMVTVPELQGFTQDLLAVRHKAKFPYPCFIEAPCFFGRYQDEDGDYVVDNEAYSDGRLEELLQQAVRSVDVSALLYSLIARSNEESMERLSAKRAAEQEKIAEKRTSSRTNINPRSE